MLGFSLMGLFFSWIPNQIYQVVALHGVSTINNFFSYSSAVLLLYSYLQNYVRIIYKLHMQNYVKYMCI